MNRNLAISALASVLFVAGCGGTYEPTGSKQLAECYNTEFDTPPPAAVGSLQAKQVIVGDAGAQWLRFTADTPTIDSILARGFEQTNEVSFSTQTVGGNTPSWWRPSADSVTTYYTHPNWKKHFGDNSGSRAYLAHDANKKVVYFMCSVSN